MRRLVLLASPVLAFLSACLYSSAHAARVAQTRQAPEFACYEQPAVDCGGRECSGWDDRWTAYCPDDGSRWSCRFVRPGSSVSCARYGEAAVYGGDSGGGSVHVRGYYRRDGTYVRPHTRHRPR